jgi:hypothetical protein
MFPGFNSYSKCSCCDFTQNNLCFCKDSEVSLGMPIFMYLFSLGVPIFFRNSHVNNNLSVSFHVPLCIFKHNSLCSRIFPVFWHIQTQFVKCSLFRHLQHTSRRKFPPSPGHYIKFLKRLHLTYPNSPSNFPPHPLILRQLSHKPICLNPTELPDQSEGNLPGHSEI